MTQTTTFSTLVAVAEGPADDIVVRDDGFHPGDDDIWPTLAPDTDIAALGDYLDHPCLRIAFPSTTDGRGFTLARILREQGFAGTLRATGKLISDQYAMARRAGFDEVGISAALAARQPQDQWLFRADWRAWDHRAQLTG